MFHGIAKFGTRSFRIPFGAQPVKGSVLPKVMHERALFLAEMTAHDCQIFPNRGVLDELRDQCLAIRPSFCKEQNAGGITIDAMHDKGALPLGFQVC